MLKINSHNFYNYVLHLILGFYLCAAVGLLEAFMGFRWDFHPDAKTYIENDFDVYHALKYNPKALLNNLFFVYVNILGKNVNFILTMNYIFFGWTNYYLWQIHRNVDNKNIISWFFFVWLMVNPYRLHLANYALKDTLLIFLLVYTSFSLYSGRLPWLMGSLLMAIRNGSIIYFLAYRKTFKYIIFFSLFLFLFNSDAVTTFLVEKSTGDMRSRTNDLVPIFSELGNLSGVARFVFWPILLISGTYLFFAPSFNVVMLALSNVTLSAYIVSIHGLKTVIVKSYVALGIIAYLTPGFWPYQRYTFPLLFVLTVFLMKKNHK